MNTVFTMGSQRSGTRYLSEVFARNVEGCVSRHETYLDHSSPSMFGRPIFDHAAGDYDAVRRLLERKRRAILRHEANFYVETSNAFMLSYYDLAPEFFPGLRLVHLIRDPIKVAKSAANRARLANRWRLPGRYYRAADGRKYFRWSMTGNEPIFGHVATTPRHSFQWFVLHWIEIENRIKRFLDEFGLCDRTFTLHSPEDLDDAERLLAMLGHFGMSTRRPDLVPGRRRNRNPLVRTVITEQDRRLFAEVIAAVPASYLEIFELEPYLSRDWVEALLG